MKVQLKVLNDIIDPNNGVPKIIKKNVVTNLYVYPFDVVWVGELLNRNGNPYKDRCKICCKEVGEVVVKQTIANIRKLVDPEKRIIIKGFGYGKK